MFDLLDGEVDDLDAAGALRVAAELRSIADLAETRSLQVAARYADLHPWPAARSNPHGEPDLPGRERGKTYGGEGCPVVAEFAPAELGAVLAISSGTAAQLIGDALALRHRLPRIWARVQAGEVQAWRARQVAAACWPLCEEAAALVDARVCDCLRELTPYRLHKIIKAAVMDADPVLAAKQAEQAKKSRGVWVGQSDQNGTKTMAVRAAAGDVIRFDARVDQIADLLADRGDDDSKDLRRAKAIGWLANPDLLHTLHDPTESAFRADPTRATATAGTPGTDRGAPSTRASNTASAAVFGRRDDRRSENAASQDVAGDERRRSGCGASATVYVHLSDEALISGLGVIRVGESRVTQNAGGVGPLLAAQLAELLGDARLIDRIVVKPVIDLADRISVDAYEIPDRIREQVILRYPTCVFPWCNRPATTGIDLDHVVPFDHTGPPGQTSTENLAPCCRLHHRLKTHGRWRCRRLADPDGAFEWTSPRGHVLRVDHTGTHPNIKPAPVDHPGKASA